jgi:NADPH:quinone reductase-like Zn-dependent oxidoreductase
MVRGIAQHRLRPQVDRVYGFDEVPDAFAHFEAQRRFGKVCIRF